MTQIIQIMIKRLFVENILVFAFMDYKHHLRVKKLNIFVYNTAYIQIKIIRRHNDNNTSNRFDI